MVALAAGRTHKTAAMASLLAVAVAYTANAAQKVSRPLPTLKASVTGASGLEPIRKAASILRIPAPIPVRRWDDAAPLGNGKMGGLLFGGGSRVSLAIDRSDLWDEQDMPETLEKGFTFRNFLRLTDERRQGGKAAAPEWNRLFNKPYNVNIAPTKMPGGIVEIQLDDECQVSDFTLDCSQALATTRFADGKCVLECFFSAVAPVALIRVSRAKSCDYQLLPPNGLTTRLKYPASKSGEDNGVRWVLQPTKDNKQIVWVASSRKVGDKTLLVLSISLDPAGASKRQAIAAVTRALDKGWDAMLEDHRQWWRRYWAKSDVKIPDELLMRSYVIVRYLLGAGSRLGASPLALQGVWTVPGRFPPWKGDYHHDLNTQMCYVSYPAAGHFDEGRCFLEFMWDLRSTFREFTRRFHDAPGMVFPSVMSHAGKPLTGWPQYTLMPQGNCSWVGWMFYRHWLYTQDAKFLAGRAYPFCKDIGICVESMLAPDKDGKLKLQVSSSPETGGCGLGAFQPPNSNYDHDSMVALYSGLAHMADELGKNTEAARWRKIIAGLGERCVDPKTHALGIAPGRPASGCHRHMSHVMSIFPYGALHVEGSDRDRRVIKASLDVLQAARGRGWTGYAYSWASCIAARAGDSEAALKYLTHYTANHTTQNGFHVNRARAKGSSPFTLEGNFMAMEAIHEMLLQSWGGTIRVFPSVPSAWNDISFENLRAEGGFAVSAARKAGSTRWVKVRSLAKATCRVRPGLSGEVKMDTSDANAELEFLGHGLYRLHLPRGSEATLFVNAKP